MPAPYYLTKRRLSYEESTSIIGNKGLVNYVHDYDENLASKDKDETLTMKMRINNEHY